jgi:hypothetical protein
MGLRLVRQQLSPLHLTIQNKNCLPSEEQLEPHVANLGATPSLERFGDVPELMVKAAERISLWDRRRPGSSHNVRETMHLGPERLKAETAFSSAQHIKAQKNGAMIGAVGRQGLQKMVRESAQPLRRDEDTVKEHQRRRVSSTGPSEAPSSKANLLKLHPINESPKYCQTSSINPIIVLIRHVENHVEITTDAPGSGHTVPKGEELI